MKKLFDKLKYAFEFCREEIICYTIITVIAVGVVVLVVLFITGHLNTNGGFNTTQWVANPANPASPLHIR